MTTNVWRADTRVFASTTNELIASSLCAGATVQFTILTRSMLPTLAPGDRVLARGMSANEPRLGDIVLVKTGQSWLVHRVIERRVTNSDAFFVTKGDNCVGTDEFWSADALCGIITLVQCGRDEMSFRSKRAKGLGLVLAFLSRWQGQSDQMRPGLWKTIAFRTSSALVLGAALLARLVLKWKWVRDV